MGWPLGLDYDRVADGLGLNIRYVSQSWLHRRFVTNAAAAVAINPSDMGLAMPARTASAIANRIR